MDAWVQVACPRLSMDWGSSYSKPMPFGVHQALFFSPWQLDLVPESRSLFEFLFVVVFCCFFPVLFVCFFRTLVTWFGPFEPDTTNLDLRRRNLDSLHEGLKQLNSLGFFFLQGIFSVRF